MKPRVGAVEGMGRQLGLLLVLMAGSACADVPTAAQTPARPKYITAAEAVAWPGRSFDARIAYGPEPQQFGELRLPAGSGPHPVAVVVHGGCWLSIASNDYMDPVAETLAEAGWATWNLEFRTLDQRGGAWPGIFQDIAAGTDHLREVAVSYPLDLTTVVAVGHSSGGHLALWLGSRARIASGSELYDPDPLPIRGVVGLAGIADLAHYHAMDVPACGDTPSRLLGGQDPTRSVRTAQASPAALLPTSAPQLLITGVDDYAVPPAHGEAYAAFAQSVGQEATHHIIEDSNHFELVAPWTKPWSEAWEYIVPFLEKIRASHD